MRKIAIRVAGGLVAAVALSAVGLLAFAFVPTLFGAEALIVTSGSMGDAAPVGSVAVTRMTDAHAVSVGDVISFRHPGSKTTITHRVIEATVEDGRRVFRTKGDANPSADPEPVPVSGGVHRVERVVPYAGRIVMFARTPTGGVLLFLVPIVGLLFDERRKRARARAAAQPEPPPPPAAPVWHPDALLLGAIAGLVVGGAVARIGSRPRHPRR